jgi:branched-chain amino acid transport system substrate-binding protein
MVQISPSNTNPGLTSKTGRATQQPATYRHQLPYVTYYRMITTDTLQGPTDAAYLQRRLHASTYFLVNDSYSYGHALVSVMEAYAAKIGLRLVGHAQLDARSHASSKIAADSDAIADIVAARQPDGVLYGGGSADDGAILFKTLRRKGYTGPVVGGDAIIDDASLREVGKGVVNVFGSLPGMDVSATAKSFRQAYRRRFHASPATYDAAAYDAANIILHAIHIAGTHGLLHGSTRQMRSALLPYIAGIRWQGAAGTASFDHNGDTRNRIISMYTVRHEHWVFAGLAPPVRGVNPTG